MRKTGKKLSKVRYWKWKSLIKNLASNKQFALYCLGVLANISHLRIPNPQKVINKHLSHLKAEYAYLGVKFCKNKPSMLFNI